MTTNTHSRQIPTGRHNVTTQVQATPSQAPAAQTAAASTSPRTRVWRYLAVFLATVAVATGTAGTVTPASAAPATVNATICFQARDRVFYTGAWGPYDKPVFVDVLIAGQAYQVLTLTPNMYGCLTTTLIAGYSWRFRVYNFQNGQWWVGQTGWQYASAGYNYNFGTLRLL